MDPVRNTGIKNIFNIDDKYYAYVGYVKDDCALITIFEYPSGEKKIDFPCLPGELEKVDMNGSGGAFIRFNDKLLLTTGTPTSESRIIRELAQNNDSPYGKILEIFFNKENQIKYKIYSKGHRNPQGALSNYNNIFAVEHGPRGGDELNIIFRDKNYGWPLYSLGSHYNLEKITKETFDEKDDFVSPVFSFVPSIGISGVEKCPKMYAEYYKPLKCAAISSMRAMSIYLMLFDPSLKKIVNYEKLEFNSRIRKFEFDGDTLIAGTDFDGIIIGKLNRITE